MALMVILSATSSFAQATPKMTIKEIKAYMETINPDTTCMDEYLQRRKQLIVKMSLSPLIVVGGTAGSAYVGGATGAAIGSSLGGASSWSALGYAIGGVFLGGAGGIVTTAADTTATALVLKNLNNILKTLAEQHMDRAGERTETLYAQYIKRSKSEISKEEFLGRLMAADASGALCDGSMVKQPKIKLGSKLKYKVAKLKDIVKKL